MADPALLVPYPGKPAHGRLERRYKRFFADCVLDDGTAVTAHTANTGSMLGLLERGNPVLLTLHDGTARKLPWSLEAISVGGTWVGCNTAVPNAFVAEAIRRGLFDELKGYRTIRREVKYGVSGRSRVDILLEDHEGGAPPCFVEIKNVTLREGPRALFPDAVTERGLKHVEELVAERKNGARSAFVFLVQRTDCDIFAPAWAIDEAYAAALERAASRGVEVIAAQARVTDQGVHWAGRLPIDLAAPALGPGIAAGARRRA